MTDAVAIEYVVCDACDHHNPLVDNYTLPRFCGVCASPLLTISEVALAAHQQMRRP